MAIEKGKVIVAADIYSRYSAIISSLLSAAHTNMEELSVQIRDFKKKINRDEDSPAYEIFKDLIKTPSASYYELSSKITSISSELSSLETQWWDSDREKNKNSAHSDTDGNTSSAVEEYVTAFTSHDERKQQPLHVIKNNRTPTYAADGRVNQSDFIGAYHFQATIESLYSIATRLRDIRILIKNDYKNIKIEKGQTNPLADIKLIKDHSNYVKKDGININSHGTSEQPLSVALIQFNDWVLNNPLNGDQIKVGDDATKQWRGWNTRDNPPVRYPSALNNAVKAEYLQNKNTKGRQITRNLRNRTGERDGAKNEISCLSSFYRNTNNNYTSMPTAGIAKEYLSLKFVKEVKDDLSIKSYATPESELANYFTKSVTERYQTDPDDSRKKIPVQDTNVIRSKTSGKKHVVCAETVNQMFEKMNTMLVQISASLYGKYEYNYVSNDEIPEYGAGNPKGGLGYPEVFSWYSGGYNSSGTNTINILNQSNAKEASPSTVIEYNATLRSDSFVARERTEPWEKIKAGYPGMTKGWRTDPSRNISSIDVIYDKTTGSTVPMSFNGGYGKFPSGTQTSTECSTKYENQSWNSSLGSSNYIYGTSSGGTYTIKNSKDGDEHMQVFTRYCITHPKELSAEKRITASFYQANGYTDDDLSAVDINAKYIFMPYMMFLDDWYRNNQGNIHIGTFLGKNITTPKPANKFVSQCGMPVQCVNRSSIWKDSVITGNYSDIDVALCVKKNNGNMAIIGNHYNIPNIKYSIRGILTVNEVNHTHPGSAFLNLSVGNTKVFSDTDVTLQYDDDYHGGNNTWYKDDDYCGLVSSTFSNITSHVWYGKNNYRAADESKKPKYKTEGEMKNFITDAINSMFCTKYRFHDFYDDDDPIITATQREFYTEYFAASGKNKYLGGNRTMYWNWNITKTLSSGSKSLKLYPRFKHTCQESDSMIQGNFYFSGSHANEVTIAQDGNKSVDEGALGLRKYKYYPLPDPVTISKFDLNPNKNSIEISGYCPAWWNNLAQVDLRILLNNVSNTIKTYSVATTYDDHSKYPKYYNDEADPSKALKGRPFTSSNVRESARFTGTNITVSYQWKKNSKRFDFQISCACTFPSDYAGEIPTLDYIHFYNEVGTYRSYENLPVEPTVPTIPGYHKKYACLIPYYLRKIRNANIGVRVGKYYSSSEISTRTAAIEKITALSDVEISSNNGLSMLAWYRDINRHETGTNSTNLEVLEQSPEISGMGGWVGVRTKVKVPAEQAASLDHNQTVQLKVYLGTINGATGDGVATFFGNENTALKKYTTSTTVTDSTISDLSIIKDRQGYPGNDPPWSAYDDDAVNRPVIYRMVSEHFNPTTINGITQGNIKSHGGRIFAELYRDPDTGVEKGHIPKDAKFSFVKYFKVHKSSNSNCYLVNNMFFHLGGDSFNGETGSGVDWCAFRVELSSTGG